MPRVVTARPRTWSVGSNPLNGTRIRGFTLLEILVVLSLAALLLAIVTPVVTNMLPGVQYRGAAQELAAALRYSRNRAIVSGQSSRVSIDLDNKQYQVSGREKRSSLPQTVRVDVVVAESEVEQGAARLASIRFFPDGSSTGGLVKLAHEGSMYTIAVDWLTGQVRSHEGE